MTSAAKPAMKTAAMRPMMMYVRLEPPPDESTRLTCAPLLLPKLYAFYSPDLRPYGSIRRAKRQPTFARYIASAASASQYTTTAKGRHPGSRMFALGWGRWHHAVVARLAPQVIGRRG